MKRILVYSPDNDPTSWYRGARPWQLLDRELNKPNGLYGAMTEHYHIDYVSSTSKTPMPADWDHAGFYDLVFMQRPFHPQLLQAAQNFKRMGAKLWIDEDDLQTQVPWDMASAYFFNSEETQRSIRGILSIADILTTATDYLGQKLREFTKCEIITVPNAFDLETFPKPEPRPKEKVILWRGAAPGHLANLMSVRKPLYEVMEANPDWKLLFWGMQPWWYNEFKDEFPKGTLKNIGYLPHSGEHFQESYYQTLTQINPAIWICPLVDNDFNRCRSNNAWVDASWIGAQVLAPVFNSDTSKEWFKPGLIRNYDAEHPEIVSSILNALIKGEEEKIYSEKSWDWITLNLLLPDINIMRLGIVKRLIG